MKGAIMRVNVLARWAFVLCLLFTGLTGCGSITAGPNPAEPTISSFAANPTAVAVGGVASLTGVFANGNGVITPGNIAVTSGTAVSVTPAQTTTYILTVTNTSGGTAALTATVTVSATAPTVTSFTANPTSISAGGSASLTAVFANGTGVVTPGNIAVTSGTAVTVSPTATTTYTLTVTNSSGETIAQTATVTVTPVAPDAPSITSFAASPTSITSGGTASLTGVFANGTGVITPGNLAVKSGTAVSVSPANTTIYTLTVTNTAGVTAAKTATVTVNAAGPTITSFTANPSSITEGGSTNLTGIFSNGTGVITPGNIAVNSGSAVNVSPSATTTYTLTVTPAAGAAISQSLTVSVTTAGAPAAPAALQATPGNQLVSLSWTGVAAATSYSVLRSTTSGGPYTVIGTTTGTIFEDSTVVNSTTYFYVVEAVNSSGPSGNSNQASATPLAVPAASSVLTATPGDGQAVLNWTAGAGATSFAVGRSLVSGGPYTTVGTPTATSFKDTGLTNGTPYYYVVYSVNPVATSAASNQAEAIPIAAPTGLTAVPTDKQVALFWTPSLGATSYNVNIFTQSACAGTPTQASSQTPRYSDTGLTNGTTYYYEVIAVNSTGASAPSACVSATPSASSATLPPTQDPTKHYVGMNTGFLADWDGTYAFLDMFKQSRVWQDGNNWHNPVGGTDANGWPTADASTVIFTDVSGSGKEFNGTYKLTFTGQATVSVMWCNGGIANKTYDTATNITTADVTFTENGSASCGLTFLNTKRTASSATGSGFTNAQLYLETGYEGPENPQDGTTIFSKPFLTAMGKVTVVRMMTWANTNGNLVENWADRVTPKSATQAGMTNSWTGPDGTVISGTGGVAMEYQIILCNTLMADCYFNIPPVASDDYINKMALAIAYGTDGTNPYTSVQANPVYPPLKPSLRFYLEYANEIWNSASGFESFRAIQDICQYLPANHPLLTVNGNPGIWYTMWRYPAWRMASISQTFEGVFGSDQMMKRVRPLLETQQGDGQATLDQALQWLDAYARTYLSPATTIPNLLYGGGGSAYYGVISSSSANADSIFATSNYPAPSSALSWAIDSMWLYNYGIKHVAYEGGPGIDGFTDSAYRTLNADPRMETLVDAYQTDWDQQGGDELMYFFLGPSGPEWEFTPIITNASTPKLAALADIQATPKAAVTLGAALPGTLSASAESQYNIRSDGNYSYTSTIGGQSCSSSSGSSVAGSWSAYPAHAAAAFTGTLTVSGSAYTATQLGIWINGVQQGSVTLAAQKTQALENSSTLTVTIPAGLSAIRLYTISGNMTFCGLTVTNP
jgi:fibronectin type 3 domain-containing protein